MTPTPQSLDTVTLEVAARRVESFKLKTADTTATMNTMNRIYDELAAAIRALAINPTPAGEGEKILAPYNPCLAKLRDGEPFFVLLGRDKQAPEAVEAWAAAREKAEGVSDWTKQARELAETMRGYSGAPAASPVQGVAEGWQLAPKEPTLEQGEAGIAAMCADEDAHAAEKVRDTYKAMLATTPQSPSTDERVKK